MNKVFYEVYSNLKRQGPGDIETSLKALQIVKNRLQIDNLVDIGCGTGLVSIELAKYIEGKVTTVDNYQPFIDELNSCADKAGLGHKLNSMVADMSALPFDSQSFDVIWSEGAIYIIGFENGLQNWKRFLRPSGYMVISDANWLKPNPPNEIVDFWMNEYPSIMSVDRAIEIIARNGYKLVDKIPLAEKGWTDNYYNPVQANVNKLRAKYEGNIEALEVIEMTQNEIDLFHKYHEYYGYMFYIIQLAS